MGTYHRVTQGEHLSQIAEKYGFSDYRTIWHHSENAELKQKRENPNVLFPDDRVFIPEKDERIETCVTDRKHRFRVTIQGLKLRIVLEDMYEQPLATAACELHVDGEIRRLVADGRGMIEVDIPATAEVARLIVKEADTPLRDVAIPVKIGHLDPVDEVSGQKARLMNLGYYFGKIDAKEDAEFRAAVEEFQCDHFKTPLRPDGVPAEVDGVCGQKTQAKLKKVHGC